MLTKPLPTRWAAPAPGAWEKHISSVLHTPVEPSPVQGERLAHSTPALPPSPAARRLRRAEEAPALQRSSALCLLWHTEAPEPPMLRVAPPARAGHSSTACPCCQRGSKAGQVWGAETPRLGHTTRHWGCVPALPHTVTATASSPPLMCQNNLFPPLRQPQAGHGKGQERFGRGPRG